MLYEIRGEYFVLFCICSDFGVAGADVRVGSCKYLLNQQTLNKGESLKKNGVPVAFLI